MDHVVTYYRSDGAIELIDTNELWLDVFAEWDCRVSTDAAARIATAHVAAVLAAEGGE